MHDEAPEAFRTTADPSATLDAPSEALKGRNERTRAAGATTRPA